MTLEWFINEKKPDYRWMFKEKAPEHVSQIPEEIRGDYIQYLKEQLAEFKGESEEELNYTLDDAVEEWYDGII